MDGRIMALHPQNEAGVDIGREKHDLGGAQSSVPFGAMVR